MISMPGTLNTNLLDDTSDELVITNEKLITLYVTNTSGLHNNSRVTLEISGDAGATWKKIKQSTNGNGYITEPVVANRARATTLRAEGSPATASVLILAS